MFTATSTIATGKNGATRRRSHRVSGRSHQTIPNNNTGNTATDPLLSMANTNAARLRLYQRKAPGCRNRSGCGWGRISACK